LCLRVAASPGGEDDRRGVDRSIAAGRAPGVLSRGEISQRRVLERRAGAGFPCLAQTFGDRVPGAIAHLQKALARGATALREAVAAVLAREGDAALLEPVDRVARLGGQHTGEAHVGGLVARAPDVLGMLFR